MQPYHHYYLKKYIQRLRDNHVLIKPTGSTFFYTDTLMLVTEEIHVNGSIQHLSTKLYKNMKVLVPSLQLIRLMKKAVLF